jgi:hypothetical protein
MVKKRGANQHTGKPFIEWCAENGERGERLANEFREELPTELTKGSKYKAKWKCLKCKHVWRAQMCHRTRSDTPGGCPKCANHMTLSKTNNVLAWCEKNGERGKKLLREYVDKDKPPTAVTKASAYKALWKCGTCSCEWRASMCHRTTSDRPTGCPKCAHNAAPSKTNNFLAWCEKNGELGKKLSREYVDKDRPPTAVTKGSDYKALWKCGRCSHEWRTMVNQRTKSDRPTGCPGCNPKGPKKRQRVD